jgi:hypothetical protein
MPRSRSLYQNKETHHVQHMMSFFIEKLMQNLSKC